MTALSTGDTMAEETGVYWMENPELYVELCLPACGV